MSQHFHPEFGYSYPGPRLRRDLRVAFAAFACGAALGAIAIVAVYVNYHEGENAPTVGVVDRLVAAPDIRADATAGHRKTADHRKLEQPIQQHQARSSTTENGPLIARVPLGRVKASSGQVRCPLVRKQRRHRSLPRHRASHRWMSRNFPV
jgi:hypothetical protein